VSLVALPDSRDIGFTHRADYSSQEGNRPVIDVEFATVDQEGRLIGTYETGVTVDSGADTTLLGLSAAVTLGLDLTDPAYSDVPISGIVPGTRLAGREAPVLVRLCGVWLEIPVTFVTSMGPVRHLLGREGVFDNVLFAFAHSEQALYGAA